MPKHNRVFRLGTYSPLCVICGKSYNNDLGLKLHMKYSHHINISGKKEKEYEIHCGMCKKRNCKMH